MKISHESPLKYLELSRTYNDYDYALVHLFEEYPDYLEFFKESLKMDRVVYLDNSIFELGTAFDADEFLVYVKELLNINSQKFYYIIPDALEDKEKTIQNFKNFTSKFNKGNKIGVVQGKTFEELLECFNFMKANADVVAISFDYSYYLNEIQDENLTKEERFSKGRIEFIRKLKELNLIEGTKIHLLGCATPQEFSAYADIPEIISLDTSNPVVHGILGVEYSSNGLRNKLSTKLVDLIEYKGDYELALKNIQKFKELIC